MAEYINKRDALKIMRDAWDICENGDFAIAEAINCVESLPAADVVERKRGKWELNAPDDFIVYCSECMMPQDSPCNFCPSCGADMRGET